MFPISDDNPRTHTPYATVAIIVLNALVWIAVQGLGNDYALAESLCLYGLIPGDLLGFTELGTGIPIGENLVCQFDGHANPKTLISSMFLHGSWLHIIGNMWFLWIFGDNVEDAMGPLRFTTFYVLCGLAAALAQIISDPDSLIPMVGASGAIGGVMGAYALLYPRVRVNMLIFLGFFVTTLAVPAIFMLGYWFLLQLLQALPALGSSTGGIAFWAHTGGFLAGLGLVTLFKHDHRGPGPGVGRPRRRRGAKTGERWF